MLMTFDSPDSNECAARRQTSNTPLQALTIWNDPAFFEAAQSLGRRIVAESRRKPSDETAGCGPSGHFALPRPPPSRRRDGATCFALVRIGPRTSRPRRSGREQLVGKPRPIVGQPGRNRRVDQRGQGTHESRRVYYARVKNAHAKAQGERVNSAAFFALCSLREIVLLELQDIGDA